MIEVWRGVKQKVVAGAAVAALLAGASVAAVSATGQSSSRKNLGAHRLLPRAKSRELAAAAGYLGVSPAQLAGELRSGKSLAEVADASAGKSAAGLTQALLAAHKARLSSVAARLPQRVAVEVNRPGGPAGVGKRSARRRPSAEMRLTALFSTAARPGSVAAGYLGVAPAQLKSALRGGRTLAQVADATTGRSQSGLVDALVAAKRSRLARASASGQLTKARQARRLAGLHRRMSALVRRQFAGASSP